MGSSPSCCLATAGGATALPPPICTRFVRLGLFVSQVQVKTPRNAYAILDLVSAYRCIHVLAEARVLW